MDLSELTTLALHMTEVAAEVTALEDTLKERKRVLDELSGKTIPDAMASVGVTKIKLNTGAEIEVQPQIQAHISKKNIFSAHDWLRRNDFGDLIKNTLALSFGRGDDDLATRAKEQLDELGLPYEQKEVVNAQTLKAWVREQVGEGTDIPTELFGVHLGQKTVIK